MRHHNTLDLTNTVFVIIDMQEAFRASISDFASLAANIALMAHAAHLLDVPVIITEQYPKGLGRTADEIRAVLPAELEPVEKTAFSACGAPEFGERLSVSNATNVLVCGIEAHICVNQTTHDLLGLGYHVHLLTECISSRHEASRQAGLAKMLQSGALPASIEMALFELVGDSRHKQFKTIQRLIK